MWKSTIRMNKLLATHFFWYRRDTTLLMKHVCIEDILCMMESNRDSTALLLSLSFSSNMLLTCNSPCPFGTVTIHSTILLHLTWALVWRKPKEAPASALLSHLMQTASSDLLRQMMSSKHFWFWLISKGGQGAGEMACFEESTQHNKIISTTGNVALVFYGAKPIVIGVSGRYDVSNTWPFNHNQFSYGLLLH